MSAMNRLKTKGRIAGGLLIFLAGGLYLFIIQMGAREAPATGRATRAAAAERNAVQQAEAPPAQPETPKTAGDGDDGALRQMVTLQVIASKLLEAYTDTIDHPRVQLQAIQMLIHQLKKAYPDTWREHIESCLRAAFPERADALYAKFLLLEEYTAWMQDNLAAITALPADQRRDIIRAKREQFFGREASVIWAKDLQAQQASDAVAELGRLERATFEEKAAYYSTRLEEIYGDEYAAYRRHSPQKAMDQFLSSEDVQQDLRSMSPDERRSSLAAFRKSMGLDEEAVKRWSDLDAARDARWQTGEAYMQRRNRLISEKANDADLDALRAEFFGDEAQTIKEEEASGFFRFNRKRIYGQN
jgi:hypothetical protein